jgi:hypothetical protein
MSERHESGDRWRHVSWARVTPDAVVGEVLDDGAYVRWSERGGAEKEGIATRFLHAGLGWHKVKSNGEPGTDGYFSFSD